MRGHADFAVRHVTRLLLMLRYEPLSPTVVLDANHLVVEENLVGT